MSNINKLKPNLKRTGINPERLNSATQIFQPKVKVFVGISFFSIFTLIIWSFFGKIPVTVSGKASFVEPESLREVNTKSTGAIFFRNDLEASFRDNLFDLSTLLDTVVQKVKIQKSELTTKELNSMVDEILKYADNYIGLTIKSEIDSNSLLNKDNTSDEIKTEFKEEAIAYIFSKEILSEMIRAIATFENEKNKFVFKQKSFNNLRAKSEAIYQDLNEQYKIIKELVEKGILPQNEEISAKQNLITLERTQTSDLAEFENEEYNLKNATLDLITKIYNLSEKLEVKPSGPSTIISTLLKSSEYVSEGQVASIVSTTNNTENPKNITAVFPLTSLQGISNGLEVLVSPVNTNVNSYGSIKGKIKTLNKVPIDKTNAIYIVGSQARADELFSNYKTMTFAELTLKAKDTISGYEWSSSNGPSYSIPIGTEASVKVITESKRPISILLPFLRGLTGQE